jgi:hypothetical protein
VARGTWCSATVQSTHCGRTTDLRTRTESPGATTTSSSDGLHIQFRCSGKSTLARAKSQLLTTPMESRVTDPQP